jgi:hypothetical protein
MAARCVWILLAAGTAVARAGDSSATSSPLTLVSVRPQGAPHYSDVCFSSRWRRPLNAEDPHETFRDAAAFHATRLDWIYSTDSSWIRECTQRGYAIGTALNSKLPDAPGVEVRHAGRIRDRDGAFVTAPWMAGWEAWWGCVNSPAYRASVLEHARRCLGGGALYLHVDDPDMNYRAVEWGGCFCSWCRKKAARAGVDLTDSVAMRAFQRESVARFYEDFRRQIDEEAGRKVPLSCNNYRAVWDVFPYDLFDFGMAELPESDATPETIYHRLSATRRRGKAQILTFVSEDIQLTRCVIATAYALGSHVLVPWDVYLKSTPEGSVRYFGRPEDFADLYGFVRACAEFLDGYEEAAVGSLTALAEGSVCPVVVESRSGRICAALRAKPGSPHAAVAVHVVDWSGDGDSALVRIDRGSLPMREPVRAALLVPPRYVAETHREAESSGAYQSLKHEVAVAVRRVGNDLECSLPPLSPWGILLLKGSGVGED